MFSRRPLPPMVYSISAITVASLVLSLASPMAMANGTRVPVSALSASAVRAELQAFLSLSKAELAKRVDVRDAKGRLRYPRVTPAEAPDTWPLQDPAKKGQIYQGTATEAAYEKYGAGTEEVIVAVLDSGGDIKHEDLVGQIWTNKKEIPGNGKDDDHNGYVDDVHGWNFLGGKKNGKPDNVIQNTYEMTRELKRLTALDTAGKLADADRAYFEGVQKSYEAKFKEAGKDKLAQYRLKLAADTLAEAGLAENTVITREVLDALPYASATVDAAKAVLSASIAAAPTAALSVASIRKVYAATEDAADYNFSLKFESSSIVGNDPTKLQPPCAVAWESEKADCLESGYGNNDVTGADDAGSLANSDHGTHVSGIIGALRKNGKGADGQATRVKIMHVRMVPDGDEQDGDIALAIRYAADNGARVINMSFGKGYSPHKKWIDDAVRYAEKKGVLLVHAAGNENANTEEWRRLEIDRDFPRQHNFPNKNFYDAAGNVIGKASNWIEVGASSPLKDKELPAVFSNYGKTSVDLFAPGNCVQSTVPGNDYACYPGTSMASPEVAGVAAYLMTVFPQATTVQIASALVTAANTTQYGDFMVYQPQKARRTMLGIERVGPTTDVKFADLSASGGLVNTLKAADALSSAPSTPVTQGSLPAWNPNYWPEKQPKAQKRQKTKQSALQTRKRAKRAVRNPAWN